MMLFSLLLSMSAVIHMFLMGNKWKWAPLLGAFLQVGWITYALTMPKAGGFIFGAICFIVVNLRNHFKWMKELQDESKNET